MRVSARRVCGSEQCGSECVRGLREETGRNRKFPNLDTYVWMTSPDIFRCVALERVMRRSAIKVGHIFLGSVVTFGVLSMASHTHFSKNSLSPFGSCSATSAVRGAGASLQGRRDHMEVRGLREKGMK